MPGHQVEGERCLPIAIELGPVHSDNDFLPGADQMRHPAGQAVPDIDVVIAEQSVDLLDRVLGHQIAPAPAPARSPQPPATR